MASTPAVLPEGHVDDAGRRLRAARAKAGVTRKQLASASGTSERYLAHLEAGTGNPSLSVLTALAGALDIGVVELLPHWGERDDEMGAATQAVRNLPRERLPALHAWLGGDSEPLTEKGRRIVLVGLRGAGKTTLGKGLSERLSMPFLEMSKEVERAYGGAIGLLIELSGQSALRRYEQEAWESIRTGHDAAVIALPGGIVADGPLYNRILATSHSIWLQASPEDHMERVMAQGDFRPMSSNRGAMNDLKAILAARSSDYSRAQASVDTSVADLGVTLDLLEARARSLLHSGPTAI